MQIICVKGKLLQVKSHSDQYMQAMKVQGLRITETRKGIFKVLFNAKEPLTISEIVTQLPESHFVSVYRSVDALHKAGLIKLIPMGFKHKVELSDALLPHHHHATCDVCGSIKEINDQKIEAIVQQLAKEIDHKPTKHHFELFGICKKCQANKRP